jgi:uncharacterized protein YjdB
MKNKLYRLAVMLVTILMVLTLPQSILAETIGTETVLPTANYRTHVQNIGWQDWKSAGQTSGTSGQSLRSENTKTTSPQRLPITITISSQ